MFWCRSTLIHFRGIQTPAPYTDTTARYLMIFQCPTKKDKESLKIFFTDFMFQSFILCLTSLCSIQAVVRKMIPQGMCLSFFIHLATGFALKAESRPPLSSMKAVLEPFISRQSTIVLLGDWTTEDYNFMCRNDFSVSGNLLLL